MKTEISACNGHLCKYEKILETGGIWEDAGFTPPQYYIQLIESLHFTLLNEGRIPEYYLKEIAGIINSPCINGLFVINNKKRMYSFAESLGIDVSKTDDNHIATGITWNIISDYMLPDGISSGPGKTISSN